MTAALVLRGDARALPLRDESVDLIVTSPPYFGQRDYGVVGQVGAEAHPRDFLAALWSVTAECWRVLKPTGSLFVNLGDKRSGSGGPGTTSGFTGKPIPGQARSHTSGSSRGSTLEGSRQQDRVAAWPADSRVQGQRSGILGGYTKAAFGRAKSKQALPWRYLIGCMDGAADPDGIGWIYRQELIWSKPNGLPESVKDRCRDSHEPWFHLTKQGDYFAALDDLREPHAAVSLARAAPHRAPSGVAHSESPMRETQVLPEQMCHPEGRLPGSVWTIPTQPFAAPAHLEVDHFAAFPPEWPRRLILAWCPPGGVVLDLFGGTGTTAMVARALGRVSISIDLSADYCRLARWRIFESDGAQKVAARTNRERQGGLL